MKKFALVILTILLLSQACSLTEEPRYDTVTIRSNVFEDYNLYFSSNTIVSDSTVHVLIVTDGDTRTEDVIHYASLYLDNYLVVGIGYPDDNRRVMDFTPCSDCLHFTESGGADRFISFILQMVLPRADSVLQYRCGQIPVNTKRTIVGHSLGGLFSTYMLFASISSNPFDCAVALSPALYWDSQIIFFYENEYARFNDSLNSFLYMSIGELETDGMTACVKAMEERLSDRDYTGFNAVFDYFPSQTHMSAFHQGIENAMKMIRDSL
ncbi:MAG: alpha/beta hydrolase-fold protein [candidate division WOR-3 bacterium]|nr:alpha/beta hydrolase-fold protein [candidate division WOR-3 bacterium]